VEDARQLSGTKTCSAEDIICTLSAFTAKTVADFILANLPADSQIFASVAERKTIL